VVYPARVFHVKIVSRVRSCIRIILLKSGIKSLVPDSIEEKNRVLVPSPPPTPFAEGISWRFSSVVLVALARHLLTRVASSITRRS
jgi:hypothetical protein